jgi:hypothetical protein
MQHIQKVKSIAVATLLAFNFSLSTATAQESLNATGGNASGSGGSVSYSVGQFAYQTYTGSNGSVAEGVQQPYEISLVTAIEEALGINLSVAAYPNPTADYLTLSIEDNVKTSHDLSLMSYQLYDMQGKLLQSEKITDNQTSIIMSNLMPAIYFVKIIQGNKEVKTFKIIKN